MENTNEVKISEIRTKVDDILWNKVLTLKISKKVFDEIVKEVDAAFEGVLNEEDEDIHEMKDIETPYRVEELHTIMTGGRISTDYGKLSNGNYFSLCEDVLDIYDEDYGITFSEQFIKETGGDTYLWEKRHRIKCYYLPTSSSTANLIITAILKKKDEMPREDKI